MKKKKGVVLEFRKLRKEESESDGWGWFREGEGRDLLEQLVEEGVCSSEELGKAMGELAIGPFWGFVIEVLLTREAFDVSWNPETQELVFCSEFEI